MLALTPVQWLLIAAAAALYVITCVRVSLTMKRLGKSPVRWFFITLVFTAIPASIVFLWYNFAWLRRRSGKHEGAPDGRADADRGGGPMLRCPRCRRLVSAAELAEVPEPKTCPRCGSLWREEPLG